MKFIKFDKVFAIFLLVLVLVIAAALGISSFFGFQQNKAPSASATSHSYFVENENSLLGVGAHTQVKFTEQTGYEVGDIVLYKSGTGAKVGKVTVAGDQEYTIDGNVNVKNADLYGEYDATSKNKVLGEISYWASHVASNGNTTEYAFVFWIVLGVLIVIIIYNFAAAAAVIAGASNKEKVAEPVTDDGMVGDDNYEDEPVSESSGDSYYYDNGDNYYAGDGDETPIDDADDIPYQFSDSLSTTGSMEAFVYAELRKRELEVDGDRKKREIELDSERKRREMELDAEKKHREMELELEKKRLEIEREVKLRKIEADREIARVNAMSNMFTPFMQQQPVVQQQPVQTVSAESYADWESEKEADRIRDERFAANERRAAEEREKREVALEQERRRIEADLLEKEEQLAKRTREAEDAKFKAEKAAETAERAAASAAEAASRSGSGDDAFEVNKITDEILKSANFDTVPGMGEFRIPAAHNFDYTADDVYKYAASKKGVTVKDAVGKKPTTFRSGKKSFLLIYRLDDHLKLTLKCGPSYASKVKEIYPELDVSRFPYGLIWFALEPADKVGFEVITTLIDISYEISLKDY